MKASMLCVCLSAAVQGGGGLAWGDKDLLQTVG